MLNAYICRVDMTIKLPSKDEYKFKKTLKGYGNYSIPKSSKEKKICHSKGI
jgi:hypothetical protein